MFHFDLTPRRLTDLGKVSWDVTLQGGQGGQDGKGERKLTINAEARAWERGVDELAQQDSEVADYVRTLEEAKDAMDLPEASGDAIAREFERYFRRHGGAGESTGPGGI